MKKVGPQGNNGAFGQNIMSIMPNNANASLRSKENSTNLTLRSGEDGLSTLFIDANFGIEKLGHYSKLRSLSIENLSFLELADEKKASELAQAFSSMYQLSRLNFTRSLNANPDIIEARPAYQNLFSISLKSCDNLEELELHYNDSHLWHSRTWKTLRDTSGSLKLKRFSLRETAPLKKEEFTSIFNILKKSPVESCEIIFDEMKNIDPECSVLLLKYLSSNKRLFVLSLGVFDLNESKDCDFITKALTNSQTSLRSLGLKLVKWNSDSKSFLLSTLERLSLTNLTQLTLDLDDLSDQVNLRLFAEELLKKTNIIDLRFVQNNVDVTPDEIKELCVKKTQSLLKPAETTTLELEKLIPQIAVEYSCVPMLGYQIKVVFDIYLLLIKQDKTKRNELTRFCDNLTQKIEGGRMSYDSLVKLFNFEWDESLHEEILSFLTIVKKGCTSDKEIKDNFGQCFLKIVNSKLNNVSVKGQVFSDRTIDVNLEIVEGFILEVIGFIEFVNQNDFHAFIDPAKRHRYTLGMMYTKDVLFHRLGREKLNLKATIISQIKEMLATENINTFYKWFHGVILTISVGDTFDEDSTEYILKKILPEIKKLNFLVSASEVMEDLKKNSKDTDTQYYLSSRSLAILYKAVQQGYKDPKQDYDRLLNEFMTANELSKEEAEKEIIQCADDLFSVNLVQHTIYEELDDDNPVDLAVDLDSDDDRAVNFASHSSIHSSKLTGSFLKKGNKAGKFFNEQDRSKQQSGTYGEQPEANP